MEPDVNTSDSVEPEAFEFWLLGLPGFHETSLNWQDGVLVVYQDGAQRVVPVPSESWAGLWALLDRLHAWNWQRHYGNPDVVDGEEWTLIIRRDGKELYCDGVNASPRGFASVKDWIKTTIG